VKEITDTRLAGHTTKTTPMVAAAPQETAH